MKSNGLATAATEATGSVVVARHRQQRHDPAQAPAEELDGPAAGVLADRADRVRQHVADPELEPEVAVGERDRPVLDEVRRVAHRDEVLGHRAAAPQVEAHRRRGERRDEQHGQVALGLVVLGQVAVDDALGRLVDDPRGRAAQVRDAAAEHHVVGVRDRAEASWFGRSGITGRPGYAPGPLAPGTRAAGRRSASGSSSCGQCPQPVELDVARVRHRLEHVPRAAVAHHPVAVAPDEQRRDRDPVELEARRASARAACGARRRGSGSPSARRAGAR